MTKTIITELKNRIKKLERLLGSERTRRKELSLVSERDILTGIYNRRGFIEESNRFLKEIYVVTHERRKKIFKDFSIIFIDLDNLKIINDEFGHKAGDEVIKKSAKIFRDTIRDFDIVARWGGDEFIVGLFGANEKNAFKIAKKLKNKLNATQVSGRNLSASFGVIDYKKHRNDQDSNIAKMIEKADMAMYESKKSKHKGEITIYADKK